MFSPSCPLCEKHVLILGSGWRARRKGPKRVCPFCGGPVELRHRGGVFLLWLTPMLVAGFLVVSLVSTVATWPAIAVALYLALYKSIYLGDDTHNQLLDADTQQKETAAGPVLPAGQRQRYLSRTH